MKVFVEPKMEIEKFFAEDIVTTSGTGSGGEYEGPGVEI